MNDIRPRNIGANGIIFDPALDSFSKGVMWTGVIAIPSMTGYLIYQNINEEEEDE